MIDIILVVPLLVLGLIVLYYLAVGYRTPLDEHGKPKIFFDNVYGLPMPDLGSVVHDTLLTLAIIISSALCLISIGVILSEFFLGFYSDISEFLSSPLTLCLITLAGFCFYWLRGRYPIVYGALELVVGVVAIWLPLHMPSQNLGEIVGVLGGMYIMVRGLDNIEKGLPRHWKARWLVIFPKVY